MSNVCGHWDDGVGLRRAELVAPVTFIRNSYKVFHPKLCRKMVNGKMKV